MIISVYSARQHESPSEAELCEWQPSDIFLWQWGEPLQSKGCFFNGLLMELPFIWFHKLPQGLIRLPSFSASKSSNSAKRLKTAFRDELSTNPRSLLRPTRAQLEFSYNQEWHRWVNKPLFLDSHKYKLGDISDINNTSFKYVRKRNRSSKNSNFLITNSPQTPPVGTPTNVLHTLLPRVVVTFRSGGPRGRGVVDPCWRVLQRSCSQKRSESPGTL